MSCIYDYNPPTKGDGPHALQEGGAVFNKPESGGKKWPAWLLAFVVVVGVLAMLVLGILSLSPRNMETSELNLPVRLGGVIH